MHRPHTPCFSKSHPGDISPSIGCLTAPCQPQTGDQGGWERHQGCAPEAPGEPGLGNATNPCLGSWLAGRAAGMRRFPDSSTFCGCPC